MYIRLNRNLYLQKITIEANRDLFASVDIHSEEEFRSIVDELNASRNIIAYKTLLFRHFKLILDDAEHDLLCESFDNNEIELLDNFIKYLIVNEFKLVLV